MLIGSSCEKDLPLYSYPDNMLNFELSSDEVNKDILKETFYSFVYEDESVMQDTLWVTINTMGFLSDQDRPLTLQQVPSGKGDATPGVHYVPFDDPELCSKYYYIPAGKETVEVPVVVKKDASLSQNDVRLYLSIKENEYFKQGYPDYRVKRLVVSNKLSRPDNWSEGQFDAYGPVKHQLMIDVSGKKWDYDYIEEFIYAEFEYQKYIGGIIAMRLREINEQRHAEGLGDLCEEDGTPITFTYFSYFI